MASKPRKPNSDPPEESRISRGRTRPGAIFPVAPPASALPETYAATLQEIKTHLRNSRIRAILATNPVVIEAYWHTGKIILTRQQEAAWGAKVIDRLAADLQEAFPDMSGLSSRNLLAMKIFAREFPSGPIAQQPVAQLPWGHKKRTGSSPSMPCAAWTNPSPSPPGRPNSPTPSPTNCAAACPPSRKSKPSWPATFLPNPQTEESLMTDAFKNHHASPTCAPRSGCGVPSQAIQEASRPHCPCPFASSHASFGFAMLFKARQSSLRVQRFSFQNFSFCPHPSPPPNHSPTSSAWKWRVGNESRTRVLSLIDVFFEGIPPQVDDFPPRP